MINASMVSLRDENGEYVYHVFHEDMCWPVYDKSKRQWRTEWGDPVEWLRCGDSESQGQKFTLKLYRKGSTRIFTELDLSRLHVEEQCPLASQIKERSKEHYLAKRRKKARKQYEKIRTGNAVGHVWRGHKYLFPTSSTAPDSL